MDAMTDKQATYRQHLIADAIRDAAHTYTIYKPSLREQHLVSIALLLSLPTPATSGEASEQIDGLKGGGIMMYARSHQTWAQPVLDTLTSSWGTDARQWPAITRSDGAIPTATDVTGLVQEVLA